VETFINLGKAVALFSAAALCCYLIVTLMRLNNLLAMFQKDFSDLSKNLKPILENLNFVSERLKSITTKVDDQVNIFRSSLEALKSMADNVVGFEARMQQRLEEPIIRATSMISGIVSKIASFFGRPQSNYTD
jgi:ABC-type transporter Mla subunit MlaD